MIRVIEADRRVEDQAVEALACDSGDSAAIHPPME
jgi:hypothetical protein